VSLCHRRILCGASDFAHQMMEQELREFLLEPKQQRFDYKRTLGFRMFCLHMRVWRILSIFLCAAPIYCMVYQSSEVPSNLTSQYIASGLPGLVGFFLNGVIAFLFCILPLLLTAQLWYMRYRKFEEFPQSCGPHSIKAILTFLVISDVGQIIPWILVCVRCH